MDNKNLKRSEKFWDRMSKNFDKPKKKNHQKIPKVITLSEKYLKNEDVVLDYGCATGKITIEVSKYVKKIYGIDLSSKMIEIANSNAVKQNSKNIHFKQSTIFNEDFEEEYFNVITGFNILHLVDHREQVINKIYSLIKSNGVFISSTPCLNEKSNIFGMILGLLGKLKLIPDIKSFSFQELEKLIALEKFEIIERIKINESIPNYFIVAKKK